MKKSNTKDFIEQSNKIHKNEYDYSKVEYTKNSDKVCIICRKHGEFWQTPNHHLRGCRCPICLKEEKVNNEKKLFIERSNIKHNNKYNYSKVDYLNNHTKVIITCPIHGDFTQKPKMHLYGNGCPKCGNLHKSENIINNNREKFIPKSIDIHGDRYDYSKVYYNGLRTKVTIICKEHGEFLQTPETHLNGGNCPKCNQSKLELEMEKELDKNNIEYIVGKKFPWLGLQHLDFYLPKYRIAIECQGEQHYKPIDYFDGNNGLIAQKERDSRKLKKCKDNNVELLYYSKSKFADKGTFNNPNDIIKEINDRYENNS